jgi:Coiled-coil domain-containing protein 124 /Oxs1
MPPKNVNTKVEKGMAKKAEVAAKKQAVDDQKRAAAEEAEWAAGSNQRKSGREQDAAAKADEAARKRREKADMLAAEEAALGSGGKAKGVTGAAAKKKATKPKSDLALLENALVSAADKKAKKQKELEQKKKDDEEKRLREVAEKKQKELASMDPLLANTQQMLAGRLDDAGRAVNVKSMEENGATGIDAALQSMGINSGGGTASGAISQNAKALYLEFEERMLPIVKEENPGLRLSQYKEKIWNMWKKSPDNPANQIVSSS